MPPGFLVLAAAIERSSEATRGTCHRPAVPDLPGEGEGALVVLSGLLASETRDITERLPSIGLEVTGERVLGEWTSLVTAVIHR